MKILKYITFIILITNISLTSLSGEDTLFKGYSGVAFSYTSLDGDVEGHGYGVGWNDQLGDSNWVFQAAFSYNSLDTILGVDISAADVETYNSSIGIGYIFKASDKIHLVPLLGYQYSELGVMGYEAASLDAVAYGAIARFLVLENTVISAGITLSDGEIDSVISEADGLTTDATAYVITATHHFSDGLSGSIGFGTDKYDSSVLNVGLIINY